MKRMPCEGKRKQLSDALLLFQLLAGAFSEGQKGARDVEKDLFGEEVSTDGSDLVEQVEFNRAVKTLIKEEWVSLWDWFIGNIPKENKPQIILDVEMEEAQWDLENGGKNGVAL